MIALPVSRPRLDRRTARELDRLAVRAHAFHRFAHHPLCGAYAPEVIRIGRRFRLCRGCALTGLGLAAGALLGLGTTAGFGRVTALGVSGRMFTMGVLALLSGSVLVAALTFRSEHPRGSKWFSRGVPSVAFGAAVVLGLESSSGMFRLGFLTACIAFAAGLVIAYRRRGPNRDACATCPERSASPCSGFAPIVRRERAFRRKALAVIDARVGEVRPV